jgi:trimeric autotransporter adhesin
MIPDPSSEMPRFSGSNRWKDFMKTHAACAALLCLGLLSGCGSGAFAPGIGGNLKSIDITPSGPSVPLGETQQLTATGHYRDGSTQDITASVAWSSSNTNVATVSGSGLGTSHSTGSSTITATLSKVTGSSTFTVTNAVLVSIAITPANSQVFLGTLNQFTATGTFSDQSTKDITGSVTWSSSNPSAASINGGGLVTALALGSLTISATSNSITGSTSVTVQSSTLTSITIVPANGSIAFSTTEQFHALGNYSDGSVQNLTRQVTWASSNTAVVQIVSGGMSRGLTPGTTTISATLGTVTGSTPFTVTNATIVSITVSPASQTIAVGTTLDFSALGRFSDGTFQDITSDATWSSDNTAVATVDVNAIATAVSPGTANIIATFNGVTGSAPLTVSTATITSIAVTPSTAEMAPNTMLSCVATATLSDGTTQVITDNATWSSSDAAVASVDNGGNVSAIAGGSATISAQFGGVTGTSAIVVNPQLTSIQVSPATASIPAQTGVAFTATGTFADGKTQDLTGFAFWTSSQPSVATIFAGNATGLAPGTSTIVAVFNGQGGSAQLTVTTAKAISVVVSPSAAALKLGGSTKFRAVADFSDGTTMDVTNWVTWTSSEQDVATLAGGVAKSGNSGRSVVTATIQDVSGTAVLSVH